MHGVKRAILVRLDGDTRQQVAPLGRAVGQAGEFHRRIDEVPAGPGGEFARDAEMAETVGAVGRDFEVEHDVAGWQHIVDGRAERGPAVEDEQTLVRSP